MELIVRLANRNKLVLILVPSTPARDFHSFTYNSHYLEFFGSLSINRYEG